MASTRSSWAIEALRSRRVDLDSASMESRCGLVRCVRVLEEGRVRDGRVVLR